MKAKKAESESYVQGNLLKYEAIIKEVVTLSSITPKIN